MPRKSRNITKSERWIRFSDQFSNEVPHLMSWMGDSLDFSELKLKARDDQTVLAIAKGYDSDGGPVVCFGVGYDAVQALIAIDATMQGGRWRVDIPWEDRNK